MLEPIVNVSPGPVLVRYVLSMNGLSSVTRNLRYASEITPAVLILRPGTDVMLSPAGTTFCGMYSSNRLGVFHTATTIAGRTFLAAMSCVIVSSIAQSTPVYDVAG